MRVSEDVEIPAGSGPVRATLSIPPTLGTQYEMTISENGKKLAAFTQGWNVGGAPDASDKLEVCPEDAHPRFDSSRHIASISRSAGALPRRVLQSLREPGEQRRGCSLAGPGSPGSAFARTEAELPSRWIDYSSLDIVCLLIRRTGPLEEEASRRIPGGPSMTAAGGNLFVYGIGERWNRLQELEALAGLTHEANRPAKSQVRAGAENGGKTGGGTSLSEAKGVVDVPDVGQIANLPTVRQVGNLPHEPATPFVEGVPPR